MNNNNLNNTTTSTADSLIGNNNMINSYNYDTNPNLIGGNGVNDILLSIGPISPIDSNSVRTGSGMQQQSPLTNTSPSHLINPLGTPDIPHIVLTGEKFTTNFAIFSC